MYHKWNQ
jgi:hypothetical protein